MDCFIKIRSKQSCVLLLCLLRIFMKQTLPGKLMNYVPSYSSIAPNSFWTCSNNFEFKLNHFEPGSKSKFLFRKVIFGPKLVLGVHATIPIVDILLLILNFNYFRTESGFHGKLTRVQVWQRALDASTEIPRQVRSCRSAAILFDGLILRWSGKIRIHSFSFTHSFICSFIHSFIHFN